MINEMDNDRLPELMEKIEKVINQNPGPIDGVNVIYQFNITGDEEGTFQLQLAEGKAKVSEEVEGANCTLVLSLENFRKFLVGKLNGTAAFMTGKLKIKGDIGKAIKLEGILREYNLKEYL
ncbi:SCP2 sterol-binding domain-containing protein [Fredinandcohnia sp. QZ13]|uniref:SCP2 sterol-binding domain-containing protein n=1 Tax=Fredinandcohnia sp. QZ13 TaxID=3073144 RepID=UPI002853212C|nr:SCP2 sterol-binding domain-containing protein [Fredinandcohnia sp. QZ13]MDR4888626.1 SCP2 sterol-binding domain-containing protein [Fredinandcohnia sp. QZ13]